MDTSSYLTMSIGGLHVSNERIKWKEYMKSLRGKVDMTGMAVATVTRGASW
jgi:hypothetical protein